MIWWCYDWIEGIYLYLKSLNHSKFDYIDKIYLKALLSVIDIVLKFYIVVWCPIQFFKNGCKNNQYNFVTNSYDLWRWHYQVIWVMKERYYETLEWFGIKINSSINDEKIEIRKPVNEKKIRKIERKLKKIF